MLEATCHCGAVRIELDALPERLIRCTCSICRRYGALWAHCTRDTTRIFAAPGATAGYQWSDRVIEFVHCTTCGCLTHYVSTPKSGSDRVSVNARMLPPEAIQELHVRIFDGADTWQFLDE